MAANSRGDSGFTIPRHSIWAGPLSTFLPHGVALLDRAGGEVIAELSLPDGVLVSWFSSSEGVHAVSADGRGMFQLGAGGKGWCENVGAFKVELAPFDE